MKTFSALLVVCLAAPAWGQLRDLSVVHAATFQPGLPARGSLATAFVKGLTRITVPLTASGFPLPTELGGVKVRVGGAEAPLVLVAAGDGFQQINFQVPLETPGNINTLDAEVVVEQDGARAAARAVFLPGPGEFFRLADTRLYPKDAGVFQHVDDLTVVRLARPATPGEALVGYMTGIGTTTPLVKSGTAAPFFPPARVTENPPYISHSLQVGGKPAQVLFVGLTPGLAGLAQVNFVVPDLPAGVHTVELTRSSCTPIFSECGPGAAATRVASSPVTIVVGSR